MKKSKKTVLTILIVALIFIIFPWNRINAFYVGIKNDGVFYRMSEFQLLLIKGWPEERINSWQTDCSADYDYTEDFYGIQSKVTYRFYKTWYSSRLTEEMVTIPIKNIDQGKTLFNEIHDEMLEKYKTKNHFFDDGIQNNWEDHGKITSRFGTYNGAIGVSVNMELTSTQILIETHDLF